MLGRAEKKDSAVVRYHFLTGWGKNGSPEMFTDCSALLCK